MKAFFEGIQSLFVDFLFAPHDFLRSLELTNWFGANLLNWIFIILTLYKAYYIIWAFMHLEAEKSSLKWSIVAPVIILVAYLLFILLVEADYIFEVFKNGTIKWNF